MPYSGYKVQLAEHRETPVSKIQSTTALYLLVRTSSVGCQIKSTFSLHPLMLVGNVDRVCLSLELNGSMMEGDPPHLTTVFTPVVRGSLDESLREL